MAIFAVTTTKIQEWRAGTFVGPSRNSGPENPRSPAKVSLRMKHSPFSTNGLIAESK